MKFPKNLVEVGDYQLQLARRIEELTNKGNNIIDEFIIIAYQAGVRFAKEKYLTMRQIDRDKCIKPSKCGCFICQLDHEYKIIENIVKDQ